MRLFDTRFMRQ